MISVPGGSDAIAGTITGVSVTHHTADVDTIELASAAEPRQELEELLHHGAVEEAFVLQTCNRAERYVVTEDPAFAEDLLRGRLIDVPSHAQRWFTHEEALEHLLRVGAGLESMVVGEDQILGQLRRAWEEADRADALGPLLDETVWKAINLGKQARTETDINDGVRSLSRAATDVAADHVHLGDASGVVLGAGRMAERAAQAMLDAGVPDICIANRTMAAARELAEELEGDIEVVGLEDFPATLAASDILITATASPKPIVTPAQLGSVESLTAVDMGQPRDVDPAVRDVAGVSLYDLDDLESITATTSAARRAAASAVEEMVATELDHLHFQLKRKQADDVIAAMYAGAEEIKEQELEEARARLERDGDLTERECEILESFADALIGKIMAAPTKSLREAAESDDWETIQVALQLFDPVFPSGKATAAHGNEIGSDRIAAEEDR